MGQWNKQNLHRFYSLKIVPGVVENFEGFTFYRSGNSHKCIIWNYDIFGFDGGRTKQMVDFFADNGN